MAVMDGAWVLRYHTIGEIIADYSGKLRTYRLYYFCLETQFQFQPHNYRYVLPFAGEKFVHFQLETKKRMFLQRVNSKLAFAIVLVVACGLVHCVRVEVRIFPR